MHHSWRGKRSRHSRCMRNPQFHVSGKRPMESRSYTLYLFKTIAVYSRHIFFCCVLPLSCDDVQIFQRSKEQTLSTHEQTAFCWLSYAGCTKLPLYMHSNESNSKWNTISYLMIFRLVKYMIYPNNTFPIHWYCQTETNKGKHILLNKINFDQTKQWIFLFTPFTCEMYPSPLPQLCLAAFVYFCRWYVWILWFMCCMS